MLTAFRFSALQRAEIAEIEGVVGQNISMNSVSVLFNEPKLLKSRSAQVRMMTVAGFSALQRAEIAEMRIHQSAIEDPRCFSALQRAEIAEIGAVSAEPEEDAASFSALQRAEIAEIPQQRGGGDRRRLVSVLFNEPKLLKCACPRLTISHHCGFSALQRAEIAEIRRWAVPRRCSCEFQCSSTSRNC